MPRLIGRTLYVGIHQHTYECTAIHRSCKSYTVPQIFSVKRVVSKSDTKMSSGRQTPEPAPSRQKASRKWNWSPLASLEKYFVGFTVRSYPRTYRFCFSWLTYMDCVMPLLSQTDLGMVKCAKARNAKCFKKETSYEVEKRNDGKKSLQIKTSAASSSLWEGFCPSGQTRCGKALCLIAANWNQIF